MMNPSSFDEEAEKYTTDVRFENEYIVHPLLNDDESTLILKGSRRVGNLTDYNSDLVYGVDFIFKDGTLDDIKKSKYKDIEAPNGFKVVSVPIIPATYKYNLSLNKYEIVFDSSETITGYFYETSNNDIVLDFDIKNDGSNNLLFDVDLNNGGILFDGTYNAPEFRRLSINRLYIDGRLEEAPLSDEYLNFHESKADYIASHFTDELANTVQTIYTKDLMVVDLLDEFYVCQTGLIEDPRRVYYKYIKDASASEFSYKIYLDFDLLDQKFENVQALLLKKDNGKLINEVMENVKVTVSIYQSSNQYAINVPFSDVIENLEFSESLLNKDHGDVIYNFSYDLGSIHLESQISIKAYLYEEISSGPYTYFDNEYYDLNKGEIESIDLLYYDLYYLYNNGIITFIAEYDSISTESMKRLHITKDKFSEYILNDVDLTTPGTKMLLIKRDDSNVPIKLYMTLYKDEVGYSMDKLNESIEYTQSVGDSFIKFLAYFERLSYDIYPSMTGVVSTDYDAVHLDFSMISYDVPVDENLCFSTPGLYEIKVSNPYTNHEVTYKLRVKEKSEEKELVETVKLGTSFTIGTKFAINTIYLYSDNTCDLAINLDLFTVINDDPFIIESATYEVKDYGYLIYSMQLGEIKITDDGEYIKIPL